MELGVQPTSNQRHRPPKSTTRLDFHPHHEMGTSGGGADLVLSPTFIAADSPTTDQWVGRSYRVHSICMAGPRENWVEYRVPTPIGPSVIRSIRFIIGFHSGSRP